MQKYAAWADHTKEGMPRIETNPNDLVCGEGEGCISQEEEGWGREGGRRARGCGDKKGTDPANHTNCQPPSLPPSRSSAEPTDGSSSSSCYRRRA